MAALLIKMIPLAAGAAVSPTTLAASLLILGSKEQPKPRALAFLMGSLVSVGAIGAGALALGGRVGETTQSAPSPVSAAVDFVLGLLLATIGARSLMKGPKVRERKTSTAPASLGRRLLVAAGFGVALTATNFSSLVFYLAAAKEAADSGLDLVTQLTALAIVALGFLLPILIPLTLRLVLPETSRKLLESLNAWVTKYSGYIMPVIALIFAAYLIYKGSRVLF